MNLKKLNDKKSKSKIKRFILSKEEKRYLHIVFMTIFLFIISRLIRGYF